MPANGEELDRLRRALGTEEWLLLMLSCENLGWGEIARRMGRTPGSVGMRFGRMARRAAGIMGLDAPGATEPEGKPRRKVPRKETACRRAGLEAVVEMVSAARVAVRENPERGCVPMAENETQVEMVVHDGGAHSAYANFARVTATPEEVIVDFALNPNPFAQGKQEIHVNNRLIMNFYTAKRLLSAVAMTIQRHEQSFGAIELDIRKRVSLPIPDAGN